MNDETAPKIVQLLERLDVPYGHAENAAYDFFVDQHEPGVVYGFTVETFADLRDAVETRNPQSGLLIAYVETEDELYVCGVGQFAEIRDSAFVPPTEFFSLAAA